MTTHTKEVIQYSSAVWMLLLGSGLTIASFIVTGGQIHETVLWLFAQCLLYAGSIFGIYIYITDRFKRLEQRLSAQLQTGAPQVQTNNKEDVNE